MGIKIIAQLINKYNMCQLVRERRIPLSKGPRPDPKAIAKLIKARPIGNNDRSSTSITATIVNDIKAAPQPLVLVYIK